MTSLFEDHLGLDAVVAFADGEMSLTAFQRAAAHVARCQSCAAEVAEQTSARQQLRAAACPSIPSGLLDALRSIPIALPATPPPAGITRDANGRITRHPAAGQATGYRNRAAEDRSPADEQLHWTVLRGRGGSLRGRGLRLGAGAIVAGLVAGAIAATALTERPQDAGTPAGHPDTAQVSYLPAAPSAAALAGRSHR